MIKYIQKVLPILTLIVLLVNCRKKGFEDYYARPSTLEPPIYQVLESKGNFKSLLSLIDKAGYKQTLSSAGYWTFFAPTDSAFANDAEFKSYLQRKNINDLNSVDSATARSLVQYLLVYNAFNKDRLDDFQSTTGWRENDAFRRRTTYYTGFYTDTLQNGNTVKAIASNRNGAGTPYVLADNNNKYIPYFTDTYFSLKNLTATDYSYFYPAGSFTGFNVAGAKVLEQNLPTENGVVHIIDKVITPLPSIDEYLRQRPEYNEFRKLFNKYVVTFLLNNEATQRYQLLTKDMQSVYVKAYHSLLAFSPNNENFLQNLNQQNDAQQDSYSIFAPRNEELLAYIKNVLLEYYGKDLANIDKLPPQVMIDFLNAHMWQTAVWPSKFNSKLNFLGEEARFNPQTDVFDRKILSNGTFFGTSKVQDANVFSSVYSRAYLDPKYSIMSRLLDAELKFIITSPRQQFTLFMMSDSVLKAAGYDYVSAVNEWGYTPPGGVRTAGEAIRQRLLRILATSVVETPRGELNDLSGTDIVQSYNGEFVKFTNNTLSSPGNLDSNFVVSVDSSRVVRNGKVYYINRLLTYSDRNIGIHIRNLGTDVNSPYHYFWKFLESSSIYNAANGEITGISPGSFYTVFAPSKEAIEQAVKDGYLPGNTATGVPTFAPTLATDREKVRRFILYHILNKKALIANGRESGENETLLINASGDVLKIEVTNPIPPFGQATGTMQIKDMTGGTANLIKASSNNLSNRAVIHLIDKYLKFSY